MPSEAHKIAREFARPVKVLLGVLVVLMLAFSAGAILWTVDVSKRLNKVDCIADIQSDFMAGVGHGFGTPPAPNPSRERVVKEILRASKRLDRRQELC